MPRYLTEQDIADFRAELCKVATERFARFGYEGVTMRQLAEALGCSPKTPYRYFKDKADILATVRAQAFAKFADALEAAVTNAPSDPVSKAPGRRRGLPPLRHEEPACLSHHVRHRGTDRRQPSRTRPARRGMRRLTSRARPKELAKAGLIDVDPTLFGWSMWAATHGLVMLQQAGMLEHAPDYRTLAQFHGALMLKGAAPAAPAKKPGKKR